MFAEFQRRAAYFLASRGHNERKRVEEEIYGSTTSNGGNALHNSNRQRK